MSMLLWIQFLPLHMHTQNTTYSISSMHRGTVAAQGKPSPSRASPHHLLTLYSKSRSPSAPLPWDLPGVPANLYSPLYAKRSFSCAGMLLLVSVSVFSANI